jgi:hypothetical protein
MRFRNPGGNLTWFTPLLVLAGIFLAYTNFRDGSAGLAILYGSVGLFSLLVWFDLKWVAIPLMIYFSLALIACILMLFLREFSWLRLGKLVACGYVIYEFWEWRNRMDA